MAKHDSVCIGRGWCDCMAANWAVDLRLVCQHGQTDPCAACAACAACDGSCGTCPYVTVGDA